MNTVVKMKEQERLQYYLSEEAVSAGIVFKSPRVGDAGFDLPSLESVEILPSSFKAIRTGVHLAIPLGYVGLVRDRSSVALRGAACTAGVIDASYRGEVKVVMHNLSSETLQFAPGDRIAQILLLPHYLGADAEPVKSIEQLGETERAAAGFGSTGR